jgi:hypothetical protein
VSLVFLRLSVVVGIVLAVAAFLLGLAGGASAWVALCRAALVMVLGTLAVVVFIRRFTAVLYRFVADRMAEQAAAARSAPPPPEAGKPPNGTAK